MIEFHKYFYAADFPLRTPHEFQKISQKRESQPNVSSCPAIQLTSHLYKNRELNIFEKI